MSFFFFLRNNTPRGSGVCVQQSDSPTRNDGNTNSTSEDSQHFLTQIQESMNDEPERSTMSLQETLDQFEVFKDNAERLEAQCAEFRQLIGSYEASLKKCRTELDQSRCKLQQANHDIQYKSQTISDLQRAIAGNRKIQTKPNDSSEIHCKILEEERSKRRQEYAALQHAHGRVKNENARLRTAHENTARDKTAASHTFQQQLIGLDQVIDHLSHRNSRLSLDLEYLKCVGLPVPADASSSAKGQESHLHRDRASMNIPATPFVLFLVDGDAYTWTSDLFAAKNLTTNLTPGALAAHRIKLAIRNYICQHPEQISQEARIMVRIMSNPNAHGPAHSMFMQNFTEAMPLFDYVNAGKGKERVDSKMHEWISLFIHNPACQKLFLACSTDNGFARCLEQHVHDESARQKLCLVSDGLVASEIERLQLEDIELPGVFARKLLMMNTMAVTKRKKKNAESARMMRQTKAEAVRRVSWVMQRRAGERPAGLWTGPVSTTVTVPLALSASSVGCGAWCTEDGVD